jgi:hypothetical protein
LTTFYIILLGCVKRRRAWKFEERHLKRAILASALREHESHPDLQSVHRWIDKNGGRAQCSEEPATTKTP